MDKTKIVIFGTGKYYEQYKNDFRKNIIIIAFIDNSVLKQGTYIDGIKVYSPQEITTLNYDFVFTLSTFFLDMQLQLEELGAESNKILTMYDIDLLCYFAPPSIYEGKRESGKNVFIVTHALTHTGAQNVLLNAIDMLCEMGNNVTVFCSSDGPLRNILQEKEVTVIICCYFRAGGGWLKKYIDEADLIIVNTVWLFGNVQSLLSLNKHVLWWIHETTGIKYVSKDMLMRFYTNPYIHIYVVSNMVRKIMLRHYECDIDLSVLSYGISPMRQVKREAFDGDKVTFAIVGTFDSKVKGQDIFIDAIELLENSYKRKAEFQFIGCGKLRDEEITRIEHLSCARIVGEVENSRIVDMYEGVDVVVSCSRVDALPVVIVEGCMYKRLVITSDAAGIFEYVNNGKDGFVFKSEDSRQLSALFRWVIDNREESREMSKRGHVIFRKHFSMDKFGVALNKTVADCLGER